MAYVDINININKYSSSSFVKPTKTTLVPPRSVQIVDSNGRSLEQIYGPLSESSDLTLLCLAKGGELLCCSLIC